MNERVVMYVTLWVAIATGLALVGIYVWEKL